MTKIYACLIGNWVCLMMIPNVRWDRIRLVLLSGGKKMLIFMPHLHEDLQILFMNSLI